MAKFCSEKNTAFCCRILILLFIVCMLFSQVVLVWNYYFSLIIEMDLESEAVPILRSIVHYCNKTIQFKWNIDCYINNSVVECYLDQRREKMYYIQSNAKATINGALLEIPKMTCDKFIVWELQGL